MKRCIYITCSALLFCMGCNREIIGPMVIPFTLLFQIRENGSRLDDTTLNEMKLYYYNQQNVKKYVSDFTRGINDGPLPAYDLGILVTREIGDVSGDNGIKDFYLEYPSGDIDTIYADYKHVSGEQAMVEPCYCYYPLRKVKFNGVEAHLDSSLINMQNVYLFYK